MNRSLSIASALIIAWIIGYLLIVGSSLLIPFVLAIFIWNLLNTLTNAINRVPIVGNYIPSSLRMLVSLVVVGILAQVLVTIITNNITDVISASSRYQENLTRILQKIDDRFHIKLLPNLDYFIGSISPQRILINLTSVFTTVTSSAVLIGLYVAFMFVEQHFFQQKINRIFKNPDHRALVVNILDHITQDTQTYLGIKTLMSLVTALASYFVMRWASLDFAEFWAMLIFFLNFIPNIGAIVATVFPALLALIQFQTWGPFIIITTGLVSLQFIIGNIIEPRFMGKSLNLSTLVIMISLSVWGAIWGILGMFLSVPITVIMMIVFAHFEATKPVAILLSQDGRIKNLSERLDD